MSNLIERITLEYVNPAENSDKFYTIERYSNNVVITINGRRGSRGQRRQKHFGSEEEAREFASSKRLDKLTKGYRITDQYRYEPTPHPLPEHKPPEHKPALGLILSIFE